MSRASISLPATHVALLEMGYILEKSISVEEGVSWRWYVLRGLPSQSLFLEFSDKTTLQDIERAITAGGENPEAFFALYNSQ